MFGYNTIVKYIRNAFPAIIDDIYFMTPTASLILMNPDMFTYSFLAPLDPSE
jgi:hypothetical protein